MKTTSFISTVALIAMSALASATNPTTPCSMPTADYPPCCKNMTPPTTTPEGQVQSCGQEWLNLDTVTIEAANGNPIAQYTLAYLTDTGTQVPQDTEKAAAMYTAARPGLEAAAAQGHPGACQALAHMCMTGKGCAKNPQKAKQYMQKCKDCCKKKPAAN